MWTILIPSMLIVLVVLAARWRLQKFLDSAYEN